MHYKTPTTEQNIDERIAEWHNHPKSGMVFDDVRELLEVGEYIPIHKWLGLSFGDYGKWVETVRLPKK